MKKHFNIKKKKTFKEEIEDLKPIEPMFTRCGSVDEIPEPGYIRFLESLGKQVDKGKNDSQNDV